MREPTASRPYMPGYGLLSSPDGKGLLLWNWAVARLDAARTYWVATTRPDGRPHNMPVWGVWLDDALYFSTGAQSRKARNLAAQPACVLGCEVESDVLSLEGQAALVTDPAEHTRFAAAYGAKYDWPMTGFTEPIYAVRPTVVFAFPAGDFTGGATRWAFVDDRP